MVCDGPDPIENNPEDINPPPRHDLIMNGNSTEDSDDNENDYFGYEPLAQGPETAQIDNDTDDETVVSYHSYLYGYLIFLCSLA